MPEYLLASWLARQLDRLAAANALATRGMWSASDIRSVAPQIGDADAELAAAARNGVGNLIAYGRWMLAEHARCVEHNGCTACKTCPEEHYPCSPLRHFGAVFAHRDGYRMIEWMP